VDFLISPKQMRIQILRPKNSTPAIGFLDFYYLEALAKALVYAGKIPGPDFRIVVFAPKQLPTVKNLSELNLLSTEALKSYLSSLAAGNWTMAQLTTLVKAYS
jgi:hypothetical protein